MDKLHNKNLKKIINVYQPKYKNLIAQGFGDYLRGCFCLLQICKKHGIEFDMDLSNHPMSKFINVNNNQEYNNINRSNIEWFPNANYIPISSTLFKTDSINFHNKLMNTLNKVNSSNHFIFCNSFPIYKNIGSFGINFIKSKIEPNAIMKNNIETALKNMGLKEKEFTVIHIRCGDKYLLQNNKLDIMYVKNVMNIFKQIIHPNKKYLIISDNNNIKYFFRKYNNCVFYIKNITHLGEISDKSDEKVKNTLLDFYLMSKSRKIISLAPYNWGSGFSEWCSVIYRIPYQKIINNIK
jgi:hypothetical protein